MKNIHVLPTDKASNLLFEKISNRYYTNSRRKENTKNVQNQNIYITSGEEIKEWDWCFDITENIVVRCLRTSSDSYWNKNCKKIILTTDQDLIKDGVQPLDDEFLEWFVESPNCEEVELESELRAFDIKHNEVDYEYEIGAYTRFFYKIIIPKEELTLANIRCTCMSFESNCFTGSCRKCGFLPKEEPKQFKGRGMLHYSGKIIGGEPKQETLEEAKIKHTKFCIENKIENPSFSFDKGAKWQQERMYSEEEVEDLIYKVCGTVARLQGITLNGNHIDTAYKQFKKK